MIESRVQEFSSLIFEKQKEKLMAMLGQIEDPEWFFQKVLKTIEASDKITSEQLTEVYRDIIEFWEELQNITKEEKKDLMSKLHQKILDIHEQEEKERAEENPDDLLNSI